MTKDQLLTRRRALLAGAAAVTAAGTAGALALGRGTPPAGPPVSAPAPGTVPSLPLTPSAYRLDPLTGHGAPRPAPRRPAVRSEPLLRMTGSGRTMLLTFDDGPHPRYTPRILDTLAEYDVRATFFVCGEMAQAHPALVARMAEEGHVVGNHTWTHPLLTGLTRGRIRSEMESTSEIVEKVYGQRPQWFRAPYGAWNRSVFQLGADLGMEPLAWTVDSLDWTTPGTGTIIERIESGAAPGVVVLSHDAGGDRSQSVDALRSYLPRLLDSGYHLTVPRRQFT
ncbi:polysaccharide deacetylase family protein [Streptomyces sp. SCSIO 75703]|uniref:polysaccharide deacetylase family protein n=1 Tax=unclassified Streptomyces TaxID=2593676 RepID=UPI0004BF1328|nr:MULTISPECIES: polysaccharide deacetylase family protein [unclassified Streptomyces]